MVSIDVEAPALQFSGLNTGRAMHRILTFFIGLYWMTQFALLALRPPAVSSPGFGWPGFWEGLAAAMILGAALVAVLFLWLLVTLLLDSGSPTGEADDVAQWAFAAATAMLTLVLLAGPTQPTAPLSYASLSLAALLASYVAVCAERRWLAERAREDGPAAGATMMAVDAAHNSMLSRLSGRPGGEASF